MKNFKLKIILVSFLFLALVGFFIYGTVLNLKFKNNTKAWAKSNYQKTMAIAVNGTDANKLVVLGTRLEILAENEIATACFKKATELEPNFRDAWVLRGRQEILAKNYSEAIESLKQAEKIDPTNVKTYELLAVAYKMTGEESKAVEVEKKVKYLKKSD